MPFYSRKPTRIPGYDYATQNYYFITICTHEKKCIFGKPEKLNQNGQIVRDCILQIPKIYSHVKVDKFVVMPNHVHAIFILESSEGKADIPGIPQIIGQFKMAVSKQIHKNDPKQEVWQRSFHDHIIRNQKSYEKIWTYIENNPQQWEKDCFYSDTYL